MKMIKLILGNIIALNGARLLFGALIAIPTSFILLLPIFVISLPLSILTGQELKGVDVLVAAYRISVAPGMLYALMSSRDVKKESIDQWADKIYLAMIIGYCLYLCVEFTHYLFF